MSRADRNPWLAKMHVTITLQFDEMTMKSTSQ